MFGPVFPHRAFSFGNINALEKGSRLPPYPALLPARALESADLLAAFPGHALFTGFDGAVGRHNDANVALPFRYDFEPSMNHDITVAVAFQASRKKGICDKLKGDAPLKTTVERVGGKGEVHSSPLTVRQKVSRTSLNALSLSSSSCASVILPWR